MEKSCRSLEWKDLKLIFHPGLLRSHRELGVCQSLNEILGARLKGVGADATTIDFTSDGRWRRQLIGNEDVEFRGGLCVSEELLDPDVAE
jgi:hypothetical protein